MPEILQNKNILSKAVIKKHCFAGYIESILRTVLIVLKEKKNQAYKCVLVHHNWVTFSEKLPTASHRSVSSFALTKPASAGKSKTSGSKIQSEAKVLSGPNEA